MIGLAMAGQTDEIEKQTKEMDALADKAPSDVRDDLQTIRDAYADCGTIIRDSGWDPKSGKAPPQAVVEKLDEASKKLDSGEVKAAQERVDASFDEECPH
jgi:hypothetical protein